MAHRFLALTCTVIAVGCGNGSPAAPSTGSASAQVFTVVSGETGQPIAGAAIRASDQRHVTDTTGQFTLGPVTNRNLVIEAPGYLKRETLLREGEPPRVTLWPVDAPRGLGESYTREIVYGYYSSLTRLAPEVTRVTIVPAPEYLSDPLGVEAHEHAAERLTAAMEGRVSFFVAPAPSDGVAITSELDDSACGTAGGCAFAQIRPSSEIIGARVVLRRDFPREGWRTGVLHEMGHVLGLWHNDDGNLGDLMSSPGLRFSVRDFSAREKITLRMMYQRRPSNLYPDRDGDVRTPSGLVVTTRPVYCVLGS